MGVASRMAEQFGAVWNAVTTAVAPLGGGLPKTNLQIS